MSGFEVITEDRRFATPIGSHLTLVAANKIRLNSCWESAFSLDLELSGDGHCGRNTGVHPTSPGATPPGGPGQASICVAMGRPHARGRNARKAWLSTSGSRAPDLLPR